MTDGGAGEGVAIALRLAVYLDLMLLAGLAVSGKCVTSGPVPTRWVVALALAGIALGITQFGTTAMSMTGGDASALDSELLTFLLAETPMGFSAALRLVALSALTAVAMAWPKRQWLKAGLALVALAALAWNGHAGAGEGWMGLAHRLADIVHLVAAAIWLGALVLLSVALFGAASAGQAATALQRFSTAGWVIIVALVSSGVINLWAIAGWAAVRDPLATRYGQVLAVKLLLFGVMLLLAGLNRWTLTERLARDMPGSAAALRWSLSLEIALGMGVLVAVSILGTLSPQ